LDNHCIVKHNTTPPPRCHPGPDRVIADEERFVLDIIERVKKECKGTGVDLDRKGYNKHFSHLDTSGNNSMGLPGTSSQPSHSPNSHSPSSSSSSSSSYSTSANNSVELKAE
jgi:hypothetical protein